MTSTVSVENTATTIATKVSTASSIAIAGLGSCATKRNEPTTIARDRHEQQQRLHAGVAVMVAQRSLILNRVACKAACAEMGSLTAPCA